MEEIKQQEFSEEEIDRAMSRALQWLCSPRGGSNFYARMINGCGRAPRKDLWPPTAAVTLDNHGRYMLVWHPVWFVQQEGPFQLLVVVHEAAHLALQHLEKMLRIRLKLNDNIRYARLQPIMNVAADMAANDIAVRPILETPRTNFAKYRDRFIWPEEAKYNYPTGQSFEFYFNELMKNMQKDGFNPNLQIIPMIGGCNANQSNQQGGSSRQSGNSKGGRGDSPDGSSKSSTQNTEDNNRSGQGDKEGDNNKGGGGANSEELSPADGLDDNYPEWFKDLVRGQNPQNVPWNLDFDEMTSAEIERAIDSAKREAKRITKNAVEQTKKSCGKVPGKFMEAIQDLLEEPTIPWQIVLQNMMRSEVSSKLDESTAYPNPCFFHLEDEGMEPYPGFQKNFAFNIACMVDTSGSVSQSEFLDFMAEIRGIMNQEDEVTIRLIMFDHAIQYEKLLGPDDTEKFARDRYQLINRYGYGGTSFTPPLKYMCGRDEEGDWMPNADREENPMTDPPDLAILLTDGEAPVGPPHGPIPEYLPPCPLIWVLTSTGTENEYMQPRVLKIKD